MASDRFGASPVAPLYNATGRNPRDITPSPTRQGLGSVGSSGSGGYNFGISNQAPPAANGMTNDLASMFNPYNYLSPFNNNGRGNSRRSRNQSQSQGQGQPQGMSQTSSMSDDGTTQTNTFNNPGGGDFNFNPTMQDFSVNKNAIAGGDINDATGASAFNEFNQNVKLGGPAQPAKNTGKPRGPYTPKTPERVAELATKRAAKKTNTPASKTPRTPKNNPPTPGAGDSSLTFINGPSNRRSR